MSCIQTSFDINGDSSSNIIKKQIKQAIAENNVQNPTMAELTLAAEINEHFKDFAETLNAYLKENDINLVVENVQDLVKKLNAKGNGFNVNIFRGALHKHYEKVTVDPTIQTARKTVSKLKGFITGNAYELAKNYVAIKVKAAYYNSLLSAGKVDTKKVLQETIEELRSNFYGINGKAKSFIDKFAEENKDNKDIQDSKKVINDLMNKCLEIREKAKSKDITKEEFLELKQQFFAVRAEFRAAIDNFIEKHAKNEVKITNYSAMIHNLSDSEFMDRVFSSKRLASIRNKFNDILTVAQLDELLAEDESEIMNETNEGIDEMSKSWLQDVKRSAESYLTPDIKFYLDTIVHMSTPIERGTNPNYEEHYDLDNEVGVPRAYDYMFVYSQLAIIAHASSVNEFIDKVWEMSKNNPEWYGFSKIAQDMEQNDILAIKLFIAIQHPIVAKTQVLINEYDVTYEQTNKDADGLSAMVYNIMNSIKSTYRNSYNQKALDALEIFRKTKRPDYNKDRDLFNNAADALADLINTLVPNIQARIVKHYIFQDTNSESIRTRILQLKTVTDDILKGARSAAEEYKKAADKHDFSNFQGIDFNSKNFSKGIIGLAQLLLKFNVSKVSMQSRNAENNLATNMLNNCYVTRIDEILHNRGAAKQFAKTIASAPQNQYSTIFFGIHDGKVDIPGLFTRNADGTVVPNKEGLKYFGIRLFDGIRDNVGNKGVMYSTMTESDYFRAQLEMFFNPIIDRANNDTNGKYFEAFMQTPSDAPKNFTIKQRRLVYNDLFRITDESYNDFINTLIEQFNDRLSATNTYSDKLKEIGGYLKNIENTVGAIDLFDLFDNAQKSVTFEIDNKFIKSKNSLVREVDTKDGNKSIVVAPIVTSLNNGTYIVTFVKGVKFKNSNKIITNQIVETYCINENGDVVSKNPFNELLNSKLLKNHIIKKGIDRGLIDFEIANTKNELFLAFKQQLLGEINTFVTQLGNVFERKSVQENGVSRVKYVLRKDTKNLAERVHFNKKGELFANDKLTGNYFSFNRLFKTGNSNVEQQMFDMLSLYGQDGIIRKDGDDVIFYVEKAQEVGSNIQVNDANGKLTFTFSQSQEISDNIDEVVKEWLIKYRNEIINSSKQYESVIEDKYSYDSIVECMLNNTVAYYNFADLFAGDVKIYNTAQDYLKRFKEVQAGGSVYAFYDLNKGIGNTIQELELDENGKPKPILINGRPIYIGSKERGTYRPLTRRTGFKAVTIRNTVSAVEAAPRIEEEIKKIKTKYFEARGYSKQDAEKKAAEIAHKLAKGYFEATKKNDAQSYITFEEFILRRVADGTINEYTEIIEQIMDIREGKKSIEDLTLENINARIQVQKNFYFDQHLYEDINTVTSRQVKNAEFVLIPELIEGTELHDLYEIMNEYDIQQVNTEETVKAGKRNILSFWDNNGIAHKEKFKEQLENTPFAVEPYFYAYLYKQLEVANHICDTENKAGVQILKKIIDNCTEETIEYVRNYMNAYVANIKHSFNRMFYNCGWKIDDNGNVVDKKTGGEISFDDFYAKARHQAETLGLDSNFLDYFQVNEDGVQMPTWMNDSSSKLESIFNSIFNNAVTRQTLPGWHAVQVTGIGHGVKAKDSNGKFRKLRYHPEVKDENGNVTQEAYAEILLPRWSKLLPKNITPQQLEDIETGKGLDMMIGYRIPTEGKQSVSIFKVVGFLDEVYGATVMVPDEWVTQTGSDFDVDTIYAITYEMYIDENGMPQKIKFDDEKSEIGYRRRYIKYVKDMLGSQLKDGYYNTLTERIAISKAEMLNYKRDKNAKSSKQYLTDINEVIKNISDEKLKNYITKILSKAIANNREQIGVDEKTGKPKYKVEWFSLFNEFANSLKNYLDNTKTLTNEYKSIIDNLIDNTIEASANISTEKLNSFKFNEWYERKLALQDELFNHVMSVATENDIVSFDEFKTWDIIDQQTQAARNNYILDNMIDIMSHEDSREENYSRSNFEKLTDAKNAVDEIRENNDVKSKSNYSAYNPIDQIKYRSDAMDGAKLKAKSVMWDTFTSVCNFMKAQLPEENSVYVLYEQKPYTNEETPRLNVEYDTEDIKQMVDKKDYDIAEVNNNTRMIVAHKRFGNSKNNHNITGDILTAYSSQTTSHILDAIKEGTIYNENDFTFGVFKLMPSLGIDYYTAILFLAQPAVDSIVQAYNENLSIFVDDNSNPIDIAIKRLLQNPYFSPEEIDDYTPMDKVYKILNKEGYNEGLGEYSVNGSKDLVQNMNFIIDQKLMKDRITGNMNVTDELLFDLATLLSFKRLYKIATNIESLIKISNPDKFGAKQTLRETNEILENIDKYREHSGDENGEEIGKTLIVDGKYFVDALYPLTEYGDIDVKNSKYNYLAAELKYATIPSLQLGYKLFPINRSLMNNGEGFISSIETDIFGKPLNNEQFKKLKQYYVMMAYSQAKTINYPIRLNEDGKIILAGELSETERVKETDRVFGRRYDKREQFTCKNPLAPTNEELEEFYKLTPCEKVLYIQNTFTDRNPAYAEHKTMLCEKLSTDIYIAKDKRKDATSHEILRYHEDTYSIEDAFIDFKKMFNSKNPLIRLTAIDLVKYAFIVEGGNFKRNSIKKIITNDALYKRLDQYGTNMLNDIDINMVSIDTCYERFVRSHPDIVREVSVLNLNFTKQPYNKGVLTDTFRINPNLGLYIPFEVEEYTPLLNRLKNIDGYIPTYVRIKQVLKQDTQDEFGAVKHHKGKASILYKVIPSDNGIYLAPLPRLEENETTEFSSNEENNIIRIGDGGRFNLLDPNYYSTLDIENQYAGFRTVNDARAFAKSDGTKTKTTDYKIEVRKKISANKSINAESIINYYYSENSTERFEKGFAKKVVNEINDYIQSPVEGSPTSGAIIVDDNRLLNSLIVKGKRSVFRIPIYPKSESIENDNANNGNGVQNKFFNIHSYKVHNRIKNVVTTFKEKGIALNEQKEYIKLTPIDKYIAERLAKEDHITPYIYKFEEVADPTLMSDTTGFEYESEEEKLDPISHVRSGDTLVDDSVKALSQIVGKLNSQVGKGNSRAEFIRQYINTKKINIKDSNSLRDNQQILYDLVAQYYVDGAEQLLNDFNSMFPYRIDAPDFYEWLNEHPEEFTRFTNLLFTAKKFGQNVREILKYVKSEDPKIQKNLERITNAINSVIGSPVFNTAFHNLFDVYIARNFSTNPLIRWQLINIRTAFNDTNTLDSWLSDIGELNNKQVQVVAKYVYGILNSATQLIAPKVQKEFLEKYDMYAKNCNFDKIIDKRTGTFIQEFNENFHKNLERLDNEVKTARSLMEDAGNKLDNGEITEGEYNNIAYNYYTKKLEFDEWKAHNTEQELVRSYYDETNANLREVLLGSRGVPMLFVTYMRLRSKLYAYDTNTANLTADELKAIENIQQQLNDLTTGFYGVTKIFNEETNQYDYTLTAEQIDRAKSLQDYINKHAEIENKYFTDNETLQWRETKNEYLDYINDYDQKHLDLSLSQKLKDEDYNKAYNWLRANAYRKLNEEGKRYIDHLRDIVYSDMDGKLSDAAEIRGLISNLYYKDKAYDKHGRPDPRKLSKESIDYIKKIYSEKYGLTDDTTGNTEDPYKKYARVVKDVPELPVFKKDYLNDSFYEPSNPAFAAYHKERNNIITEINNILVRGFNTSTGHLDTRQLWNMTTADERKRLADLFVELKLLKRPKVKLPIGTKIVKKTKRFTNDAQFNEQLAIAVSELNKEDRKIWEMIFCRLDKTGAPVSDEANPEIYGYMVPKFFWNSKTKKLELDNETKLEKAVDEEKTLAKKILKEQVIQTPTDEYIQAREEAIANGTYDEWYEQNHIFDRVTNTFVPLPIWTKESVVPGGEISEKMASYEYHPTFTNKTRFARKEYKNENYNKHADNFAADTADSQYKNNTVLTDDERKMKVLLQSYTENYAFTESAKKFANRGFIPRESQYPINGTWFVQQGLGLLGIDFRSDTSKSWADMEDNEYSMPVQGMYDIIKTKNFKKPLEMPKRYNYISEEAYKEDVEKTIAENKKIEENNLKFEEAIRSNDYREIFKNLIMQGEDYKARMKVKNVIFLLLEDLKESKAYEVSAVTGRLKEKKQRTFDEESAYAMVDQRNTYDIVENWAHRVIFQEYKSPNKLNRFGRTMQGITSAKYMMLNVTGGIANIETGLTNIYNEIFAKDFFDAKTFYSAINEYRKASLSFIAHWFNGSNPTNKTEALIKLFNVVDYDNILGRESNESLEKWSAKVNDFLFSMQSGGEHFMQNTALIAMLNSFRVYTNSYGKLEIGSFHNYVWDIERKAMLATMAKYEKETGMSTDELKYAYENFLKSIKDDIKSLLPFDTFKKDFNTEFIRTYFGDDFKAFANKYAETRKVLMKQAKEEFEKNDSLYDQYEFNESKNTLDLKSTSKFVESIINDEDGKVIIKTIPEYEQMFGQIVQAVRSVNNKIHGVYNKIGAARLEKYWWGSLVVQYHKHIYPGIMKRYRGIFGGGGYYNEIRGNIEKGSYTSLINFIGTEFTGIVDRIKKSHNEKQQLYVIASINEIWKSTVRTFANLNVNWKLMPEWERANCMRVLGDFVGMMKAFAIAVLIYGLTDDDEVKKDVDIATALYIADRCYAESAMYFPFGLRSEFKTLWSSPVAATNAYADLFKIMEVGYNWLTDEDYNPTYTTGQYKGQNKALVSLYRNIPAYRVYNRLANMPKNNKYYRLGNVGVSKRAKQTADELMPDK